MTNIRQQLTDQVKDLELQRSHEKREGSKVKIDQLERQVSELEAVSFKKNGLILKLNYVIQTVNSVFNVSVHFLSLEAQFECRQSTETGKV